MGSIPIETTIMKPSELRIGDKVYLNYGCFQEVAVVTGLWEDSVQVLGGSAYVDDAQEFIHPIPLTKRVLKKQIFSYDVCWGEDEVLGGFSFSFFSKYDNRWHGLFGIRNVHNLQHFLSLMGIEQEIKL